MPHKAIIGCDTAGVRKKYTRFRKFVDQVGIETTAWTRYFSFGKGQTRETQTKASPITLKPRTLEEIYKDF